MVRRVLALDEAVPLFLLRWRSRSVTGLLPMCCGGLTRRVLA